MTADITPIPPLIRLGRVFTEFMASGGGRIARIVLGLALASAGLLVVDAPAGYTLAAFSIVPITAGVFNLCPVAPLWGGHFRGAAYCARKETARD